VLRAASFHLAFLSDWLGTFLIMVSLWCPQTDHPSIIGFANITTTTIHEAKDWNGNRSGCGVTACGVNDRIGIHGRQVILPIFIMITPPFGPTQWSKCIFQRCHPLPRLRNSREVFVPVSIIPRSRDDNSCTVFRIFCMHSAVPSPVFCQPDLCHTATHNS